MLRMLSFNEISDGLSHLKNTKDTVFISYKTSVNKGGYIRSSAERKGFKVSAIRDKGAGGYTVSYVDSISKEKQNEAIQEKTKRNDRYQASRNSDWTPAESKDPLLGGLTLAEKMLQVQNSGGGEFLTSCKAGHINKIAKKIGINEYAQEDQGDRRLVII